MATVKINSGSGSTVNINNGQPSSVNIVSVPYTTGEVSLAGSSGLSKAFSTGAFTNFELVSISGYPKVKISGTVNKVLFFLSVLPTGSFTFFHIRIWRKQGSTYDLVGQVDIAKGDLVAGVNEHTNNSPFDVEVGDYVGVGYTGQSTNNNLRGSIGANGSGRFNQSYQNTSTDMTWDSATSTTVYVKIQLVQNSKAYISGRRGICLGDSTIADFYVNSIPGTAISDLLLTDAELQNGYQCYSIATPNDTIALQRTAWSAVSNPSQYDWVIIQVGLNDMNPAEAASAALSRFQQLVDDIRADAPNISIIIATMNPAKARWNTIWPADPIGAQAKFVAINEGYMGNGATPITGVDYRFDGHTTALSDGSGNLAAAFDTGDGIHENDAARTIIASSYWRTALVSLGFLV